MLEKPENLETKEDLLEKIKKLEGEIERLKELAYKDELTEVFTRRALKNFATNKFEEVKSNREFDGKRKDGVKDLGVIFFDIDRFKSVNDNHGHNAGDMVLKEVAKRIGDNLRPGDILGRWGGEEFVIIIEDNATDTAFVAEKLRASLEEKELEYKGDNIKITGSFGISSLSDQKSIEEMIEQADKAMYTAKQSGRNRVAKFENLG